MDGNTQGFAILHYFLGVFSNSCPLSWWWHLTVSPTVTPFSSCPQSFPASVLHIWWLKYWNFVFSIRPSNEYSGLISFRIGYPRQSQSPYLLAVQGTLKSLLQHHSSKASIFWCSVFFMVQLSDAYITSGKTIALITLTFVSKVMSLVFNMLQRHQNLYVINLFPFPQWIWCHVWWGFFLNTLNISLLSVLPGTVPEEKLISNFYFYSSPGKVFLPSTTLPDSWIL